MRKNIIYTIGVLLIIISSCTKENKVRYKMCGVWEVENVLSEFFTHGSLDSSYNFNDDGYWLIEDNDSEIGNYIEIIQVHAPISVSKAAPDITALDTVGYKMYWYPDNMGKRMTLLITKDGFTNSYIIYTILKQRSNKIEIQYMEQTNDSVYSGVSFKEVITLKRQ